MTPAVPCRDNPWTCPICKARPCRCIPVSYDANPDWVDDVIVEQVLAGRAPSRPLTPGEKAAAARVLSRRGATVNAIALQLNMRTAAAQHASRV